MKTVLTSLVLLMSVFASAQYQDIYLKTEYLGYANGKHSVRVTNKQTCKADIQFKYGNGVASVISPNPNNHIEYNSVAGSSVQTFLITGPSNLSIEVKALSICTWLGTNPIWVNPLSNILPMKLKNFTVTKIDKTHVRVDFETAEESNVSYYNIMLSKDGLNYKEVTLIIPSANMQGPNNKYYATVEIK